jgi:uncharacterized protein YndB with AHSA1/START domain
MSIILAILLGILTILVVVIVIGYNSPKTIILDISRKITKPADVVFQACGDFKEFVKWNPWSEKDPSMSQSITGEPFTVGSIYTWQGNRSVGSGRMAIDHIEANERIDFTLSFGTQNNVKTSFIITADNDSSIITWHFESEMGSNPIYRFFGNVMKGYLTKDFSKGLDNLEHYLSAHE